MDKIVLPIKKNWFDMIKAGIKKEEYREIKPHYLSRFYKVKNKELFKNWFKNKKTAKGVTNESINYYLCLANAEKKRFKKVEFRNGYGKSVPSITLELLDIVVATGVEDWGAVKGEFYFTLQLGNLLTEKH